MGCAAVDWPGAGGGLTGGWLGSCNDYALRRGNDLQWGALLSGAKGNLP